MGKASRKLKENLSQMHHEDANPDFFVLEKCEKDVKNRNHDKDKLHTTNKMIRESVSEYVKDISYPLCEFLDDYTMFVFTEWLFD